MRTKERSVTFKLLTPVIFLVASAASGQIPGGYYVGSAAILPDSAVAEQVARGFTLRIARTAANAHERRLIDLAERLFPLRDSILAAAREERRPIVRERLRRIAQRPGERWWWDDYGDVLTPFAVTGASVSYYSARLRAIAAGPNPYAKYEPGAQHVGTFEYSATVHQPDAESPPGTAHVVHLALRWYYGCGMLCAIGFDHERKVYFDATGAVLAVRGDGIPAVMQS